MNPTGFCSMCKEPCEVEAERQIKDGTAATEEIVYLSNCCRAIAWQSLWTMEPFHYGCKAFEENVWFDLPFEDPT